MIKDTVLHQRGVTALYDAVDAFILPHTTIIGGARWDYSNLYNADNCKIHHRKSSTEIGSAKANA